MPLLSADCCFLYSLPTTAVYYHLATFLQYPKLQTMILDISPKGPFTCVNCGHGQITCLYRVYGASKQSERSLLPPLSTPPKTNRKPMTHIKMMECPSCHDLADDYIEQDNCLLFLDATLQKTRFYRHLLLNCQVNWKTVLKLFLILVLNDCLVSWFREADFGAKEHQRRQESPYVHLEFSFYRLFFRSLLDNAFFYITVVVLFGLVKRSFLHFAYILRNVVLCSFVKIFKIFNVLWSSEFDNISSVLLDVLLIFSLTQALRISCDALQAVDTKKQFKQPYKSWLNWIVSTLVVTTSFALFQYFRRFWHNVSFNFSSFLLLWFE